MTKPDVSVIIATFNSEKLLPGVLKSVKRQSYPKFKLEILLADGGSTDKTILIGRKFGCRIIKNRKTEPVYGKYLAYLKAKGKYIMYLDHDEVLLNKESISTKILALKTNPQVKAVAGGNYQNPKGYPFINEYINGFGDPFSFFIYRLSKQDGYFLDSMQGRYPIKNQTRKYIIFDLSKVNNLPIIELVAGGSMFDAEFLKKEFPETKKRMELLPHLFYLIYSKHPQVIVMKDDPILHFSVESLQIYLKKIVWRIKNNIYFTSDMGKSGYIGREKYQPLTLKLKKYLFIPYSLSVVFPTIDALYLSISRKDFRYFIHVPISFITALIIFYHYSLKLLGARPFLKNYDETIVVKI